MSKKRDYKWMLLEEKFKARDKARKLQAKEYKRRLKDLNGEAGRLRSMQQEYVPREVFDRVVNPLIEFKTKSEGKDQLTKYIPWAIALISLLYAILKK